MITSEEFAEKKAVMEGLRNLMYHPGMSQEKFEKVQSEREDIDLIQVFIHFKSDKRIQIPLTAPRIETIVKAALEDWKALMEGLMYEFEPGINEALAKIRGDSREGCGR